jgi:subtilase family serine protease
VAIVDAYDDPNIASDLATYDKQYGLTCNGCLTKFDQTGGTRYPRANAGWALEISLDVETVHGICPTCMILLVERRPARSPTSAPQRTRRRGSGRA